MGLFDLLSGDSPDAFAKQVIAGLKARGWPHPVSYDKAAFALDLGGGAGICNLQNGYRQWQGSAKRERSNAVDALLATIFEAPAPEAYEDAAPRLLPLIRNRAQMHNGAYGDGPGSAAPFEPPPHRPLGDVLAVLVGIDMPACTSVVSADQLRTWEKSFDEVLERAVENLRARPQPAFKRTPAGFYLSDFRDHYDASRLLLPEVFDQFEPKGQLIACAASSNRLLVADSADSRALEGFARFVTATVDEEPRPVSYLPLVFENAEWRPAAVDDLGSAALKDLPLHQAQWDRGAQADLSEARYQASEPGRSVEIAGFHLQVYKDRVRTVAGWLEGRTPYLPKAEAIGFVEADEARALVLWEDAEAILGPFSPVPNSYPPLFRTDRPPTADEMRSLVAASDRLGWL